VFPNPANTQLNVLFAAKTAIPVNLSLINSKGEMAYVEKVMLSGGNFSTLINVSNYVPGTYILKILVGSKMYTRKIIIDR
jgi:hypothetical protein